MCPRLPSLDTLPSLLPSLDTLPELQSKQPISFNYNTCLKKRLVHQFDTNGTSASVWARRESQNGLRLAMGCSKGTILVERVNEWPRAPERPRATGGSGVTERSRVTERLESTERSCASEWSRVIERSQARAT
jgi:hypothetical protein